MSLGFYRLMGGVFPIKGLGPTKKSQVHPKVIRLGFPKIRGLRFRAYGLVTVAVVEFWDSWAPTILQFPRVGDLKIDPPKYFVVLIMGTPPKNTPDLGKS